VTAPGSGARDACAEPSGREYPSRPIVGVGGVVFVDGRVLLIKRRFEPLAGRWSLPGGALEVGETLAEGLAREMKEETGLDVKITELLGFKEVIRPEFEYHTIIFFYLAEALGDKIEIGDPKILEAKYFTMGEAVGLHMVDSARWAIEKIIKEKIVIN